MGKSFKAWVAKTPAVLNPKKNAPKCYIVVLPEKGIRRSACYDKTVYRLEAVAHKFMCRVFGIDNGCADAYDCRDLDGPHLIRFLKEDPDGAKRMVANYLLSLMGNQNLALVPRERCEIQQ